MNRLCVLLAVWLTIFCTCAWCQSSEGSIVGTVTDSSGAAIAKASVAVRNQATGIVRDTVTNEAGLYAVLSLVPGQYEVTVTSSEFRPAVVKNIPLEIAQTARVDVKLEVGVISESVTVEASAAQVESESSTVGQVVHSKQITEMPLNGRNFIQLGLLSSGVADTPQGGYSSVASSLTNRNNSSLIINGNRENSVSWLLDGVETREPWLVVANLQPSIDAIQEFKVEKATYGAEFGYGAGIVNIATKSGANDIHGSLFEFFRNEKLDARNFFDGNSVPPLRQNQWGATFGGPIVKDQSFFFGSYESLREHRTQTIRSRFPDQSILSGDLSSISSNIYDPATGSLLLCAYTETSCPTVFPNKQIPTARLNEVAQNIAAYWPTPNVTGNSSINHETTGLATNDFDQFIVRLDDRLTTKDQLFVRYMFNDTDNFNPGAAKYFGQVFPQRPQNLAIGDTHVFKPTVLNEFRYGYSRTSLHAMFEPSSINISDSVGLRNLGDLPEEAWGLPTTSISNYYTGQLTGAFGPLSNNSQYSTANRHQFIDHLSIIRGRHIIKMGADIAYINNTQGNGIIPNGSFTFNGIYSGQGVADFVLGIPLAAVGSSGLPVSHMKTTWWSGFIQDDFKVNSHLTLNYGIRYEYVTPPVERDNNVGAALNGQLYYAKDVSSLLPTSLQSLAHYDRPRGMINSDHNNVGPRFGFAYTPGESGKTVFRGGFGVFYVDQNKARFAAQVTPFSTFLFQMGNYFYPSATLEQLLPDPTSGSSLIMFGDDFNNRTSYSQQWSFNIQRQLFKDVLFEVGYVGQASHKLSKRWNSNQAPLGTTSLSTRVPYPNFGEIVEVHNEANSNYHALQSKFDKRFANGLAIVAGYTWSKSIDNDSGVMEGAGTMSRFNRRLEHAPSDFDVPHRFTLSYIYDLPLGRGRRWGGNLNGVAGFLASGWQVSGVTTFSSGTPFYVTTGTSTGTTTVFGANRANRIADGNLPADERTPERWFDTDAFKDHATNEFGNAGRNILRQDGRNNVDLSLSKDTSLGERFTIQFRSEFYNCFNHTNFARPGSAVTASSNFGVVTSNLKGSGRSREIQFGLKLLF